MKVIQEELAQRQAVLSIEVETQEVERYLDRAYRRLVQRVPVPGFRKGKAPRAIVERLAGREALLEEALQFLVPEVTAEAVREQKLDPAGQPQVEVVNKDVLTLRATVPLAPTVVLGDYRPQRIDRSPVQVTDDQVQKALEQLQQEAALWEPVDRAVQPDDQVIVDLQGTVDGQRVFSETRIPYIVATDSAIPVPGFAEALAGAKQAEVREFGLPFPEEYPNAVLAGKLCQFTVLVKEIKQRRLQEINDEFARSVGDGYESLEGLKSALRGRLEAEAERAARQEYETKVVQAVVGASTVEIAPLVVEHEAVHLYEDRAEALARQGIAMAEFFKQSGKTEEQLREELRSQARERLAQALVLAKVAEEEKLQVTEAEVEERLNQMAQGAGERGDAVRRLFSDPQTRERLQRLVREEKTVERLVQIASGAAPAVTVTNAPENSPVPEASGGERQDVATQ